MNISRFYQAWKSRFQLAWKSVNFITGNDSKATEAEATELGRAAVLKSSITTDLSEVQQRVKHVDHLTGTKELATGPHKEKEPPLMVQQASSDDIYANITATREVKSHI